MGQAQLLLIVLGVVLVGIAIIAGINAYDTNNRKGSVDALTHDALRIASDLQTWGQKPVQFGGPTVYGDLGEATLVIMGYEADPNVNSNGTCALASATPPAASVITCDNFPLGTQVVVHVVGLADEDITVESQVFGY